MFERFRKEKVAGVAGVLCRGADGKLEEAMGATVIVTQKGSEIRSYVRCSQYGCGASICMATNRAAGGPFLCIQKFENLGYS